MVDYWLYIYQTKPQRVIRITLELFFKVRYSPSVDIELFSLEKIVLATEVN